VEAARLAGSRLATAADMPSSRIDTTKTAGSQLRT